MTAKLRANLDALAVLNDCRGEARWATADEQTVLARWSGWGSVPAVFDPDDDRHADERIELRRLLGTEEAWSQARRTTLNAHYTSADVVQTMWGAVSALGVDGDVSVLEPGCGSGNFLGFAPEGIRLTGIELDRTTAEIARHLYGARATIHASGFEELRVEDGAFDLTIGNVPFAKVTPHDPVHNRGRHALHNYFLIKSLHLTRPGGFVMALTSRYTMDARNPAVRREIADSPTSSVRFACRSGHSLGRREPTSWSIWWSCVDDRPEPNPPAPAGSTSHRHRSTRRMGRNRSR